MLHSAKQLFFSVLKGPHTKDLCLLHSEYVLSAQDVNYLLAPMHVYYSFIFLSTAGGPQWLLLAVLGDFIGC